MAEVDTQLALDSGKDCIKDDTAAKSIEVNGDHNNSDSAVENGVSDESPKTVENGKADEQEEEEEKPAPEIDSSSPATVTENVKTEEKKEETVQKVILHQFPPGKNIPSVSIFCLKLETFLRINKIPYENQYGYKLGKKGKLPWIEYQGERKHDSSFIIDYLKEKFELKIDEGLSDDKVALGRAVKVMLEENSYWCLSYNRYIDNYNEYKKIIAPSTGGGIGFNVGQKMAQRKVRTSLDGQGIGRHSNEEIYKIMEKDILAVSSLLGDKEYMLGDTISSADCTVFAFFANLLWCGLDSPMVTFVKENAQNIVTYCERMKKECWIDWTDMVLGDKPEPQLKKGFSFRKKKSKPSKPKEEPKEDETAKDDETTKDENQPEGGDTEKNEEENELEEPKDESNESPKESLKEETPKEENEVSTESTKTEEVAETPESNGQENQQDD